MTTTVTALEPGRWRMRPPLADFADPIRQGTGERFRALKRLRRHDCAIPGMRACAALW